MTDHENDGMDFNADETTELSRLMRAEFGGVEPSEFLLARLGAAVPGADSGEEEPANPGSAAATVVDLHPVRRRRGWWVPAAAAVLVGMVITGALIIGKSTTAGPAPAVPLPGPVDGSSVTVEKPASLAAPVPLPVADWPGGADHPFGFADNAQGWVGSITLDYSGICLQPLFSGVQGYTAWPAGYSIVSNDYTWEVLDPAGVPVANPLSRFVAGEAVQIPADSTDPCLPPGGTAYVIDPVDPPALPDARVILPTNPDTPMEPSADAVGLGGDLGWDQRCFTVGSGTKKVNLLWPPGYVGYHRSLWSLSVVNRLGQVVMESGQPVSLVGTYVTVPAALDSPCAPAGSKAFSVEGSWSASAGVGAGGEPHEVTEGVPGGPAPTSEPAAPVSAALPTSEWKVGQVGRGAVLAGTLVWDGECVRVRRDEDESVIPVIWPKGYSVSHTDEVATVLDEDGNPALESGQRVAFGGGFTDTAPTGPCVDAHAFTVESDPHDQSGATDAVMRDVVQALRDADPPNRVDTASWVRTTAAKAFALIDPGSGSDDPDQEVVVLQVGGKVVYADAPLPYTPTGPAALPAGKNYVEVFDARTLESFAVVQTGGDPADLSVLGKVHPLT
ncbi:hypothetical protein D1871_12280 [Nakamurella silvestris]|nr:hypothetical protein D1871_12280 [Nakamurella silvestris]